MEARSKTAQQKLGRIARQAISEVQDAFREGVISLDAADEICAYSPSTQKLMLSERIAGRRRSICQEKKVVVFPAFAEKLEQNAAAQERIAEKRRFKVQ